MGGEWAISPSLFIERCFYRKFAKQRKLTFSNFVHSNRSFVQFSNLELINGKDAQNAEETRSARKLRSTLKTVCEFRSL